MRLPHCCCQPPAPAMACGGSTAPTEPQQRDSSHGDLTSHGWCGPDAPEVLVSPPQGHLVLQGERDGGSSGMGSGQAGCAKTHPIAARACQASPGDGCSPSITPRLPGLHPFILSQLQNHPRCWIGYFPIQNCSLHWIPDPKAATAGQGTSSQAATRTCSSASSTAWQADGPISQH